MEIIPPSTAPRGSTADRAAYLRSKNAAENGGSGAAASGKNSVKKSAAEDDAEEFVGEEGGDAMIEMLSAFDDDSDEDK